MTGPPNRPLRVLFLCTGNSARSQMAESILRHLAGGRAEAFSAGSRPAARIHPMAKEAVSRLFGLDMHGQRPKPVEGFLGEELDYVISVCDRAAESCPVFPAGPEHVRWTIEDPAAATGDLAAQRLRFEETARDLSEKIRRWLGTREVAGRQGPPPGAGAGGS